MSRGILVVLLVLVITRCERPPAAEPLRGVTVIHDESRGNVWGAWDTGFYGYSEFSRTARQLGASVSINTRPLDSSGLFSTAEKKRTLLILGVAKFTRYGAKEVRAVRDFVFGGGRLLVIGEHDNMYGIADAQNRILKPFGLGFRKDAVGNRSADEYRGSSRVLGLTEVYNLLSASIAVETGAPSPRVLMRSGALQDKPNGKIIAAETRPGLGHVVALGDSEILWNGDKRAGIARGENRLFLLRVLKRFFPAPETPPTAKRSTKDISRPSSKEQVIFFDPSSGGRGPDQSLSGTAAFAEHLRRAGLRIAAGPDAPEGENVVRVLVGPLREFRRRPRRFKKLILFAESFHRLSDFSYWDRLHLERGYRPRPSIYGHLEKAMGLVIEPCFLTTGGGDFRGRVAGEFRDMVLHRAGCLRVTKSGRFVPWLRAAPKYHGETVHPGMSDSRTMAGFDDNDVSRPLIAVYNRDMLIFSDSDLVSNVHRNKVWFAPLARAILKWIRTGSPR